MNITRDFSQFAARHIAEVRARAPARRRALPLNAPFRYSGQPVPDRYCCSEPPTRDTAQPAMAPVTAADGPVAVTGCAGFIGSRECSLS